MTCDGKTPGTRDALRLRTVRGAQRIVRQILRAALCLALLSAVGCRPRTEAAVRSGVWAEPAVHLVRRGSVGIELGLVLHNDTDRNLKIRRAELDIYYAGGRVGTLRLCDPLRLGRRTATRVTTRWRMESQDPMALYVLERRIRGEEWSRIACSYRLRGRAGILPVKISGDMIPVSDFLNTFGLSPDDLRNSINSLE